MKIGEFAEMNKVTAKMLRHYDEIGLLKPSVIDPETGYRSYDAEQSHYLNWIIILKNLDFSLSEIKEMLGGPMESERLILMLIRKRIDISSEMNNQIQKKIQIDNLIGILEREGFQMEKQINLISFEQKNVHEIKKNMPNMEMFLEESFNIANACTQDDDITIFRFDICHFKQVNDDYGFDVGDRVIVACYNIIKSATDMFQKDVAIGRAGGDEFVIFARAGKDEAQKAASAIVSNMESYDFSAIGCGKQMGCYIGGLFSQYKTVADIRNMIECSIETIEKARKKGRNSIFIEPYNE